MSAITITRQRLNAVVAFVRLLSYFPLLLSAVIEMEHSPLAPWVDGVRGISEIMLWISNTLKENEQEDSYGLLVGMEPGSEVTPAVVFGFPNVDIAAVDGEAVAIPFCVRADRMSICSGDFSGIAWARRPDHFWYDVFFILVTFKMPSSSPLPCAVLLIPAQGFRDGREGFRGGREGFVGWKRRV